MLSLTEAAASKLTGDLGWELETVASPFGDLIESYRAIVALETDLVGLRKLAAGREHLLSPSLRALLRRIWTAEEFTNAVTARKAAVNAMSRMMERFDLLLTPTAPLAAFSIDRDGPGAINGVPVDDNAWTRALYPANWSGQPAASMPVGLTSSGLPVGLQFFGRHLADRTLIASIAIFEKAHFFDETPSIRAGVVVPLGNDRRRVVSAGWRHGKKFRKLWMLAKAHETSGARRFQAFADYQPGSMTAKLQSSRSSGDMLS